LTWTRDGTTFCHKMTPTELKALRSGANLTQAELAKKLGVHLTTVKNWERGYYAIPEPTARLAKLLLGTEQSQPYQESIVKT
jgi:DNA-binding transcriptional regulator YiaG